MTRPSGSTRFHCRGRRPKLSAPRTDQPSGLSFERGANLLELLAWCHTPSGAFPCCCMADRCFSMFALSPLFARCFRRSSSAKYLASLIEYVVCVRMLPNKQLFEPSPVDAPGTTFRSHDPGIFGDGVRSAIPWAIVPQSAIGAIRPPQEAPAVEVSSQARTDRYTVSPSEF